MHLMNTEQMSQKKLKHKHRLFLGIYTFLTFLCPIIITLSWGLSSKMEEVHKVPLVIIIIIAVFSIAACHFIKKRVDKIPVRELDGSYNEGQLKLKLTLKFICSAIIPIILIVVCVIAKGWLIKTVETMQLYLNIISVDLGCVILGKFIDSFMIEQLEMELDIREKVSEQNAIARRVNNLDNIK